MDSQTVLLVDDNQTHQYSLGKHLEESGYRILQASNGADALKVATTEGPNAILLDINLPDMTGFAVCEKLKGDPRTADVPIIFHSATHDTQAARAQAMDLGAISFLSYPISVEHLLRVLQGAVLRASEQRAAKRKLVPKSDEA